MDFCISIILCLSHREANAAPGLRIREGTTNASTPAPAPPAAAIPAPEPDVTLTRSLRSYIFISEEDKSCRHYTSEKKCDLYKTSCVWRRSLSRLGSFRCKARSFVSKKACKGDKDDLTFHDGQGFACHHWAKYDCSQAHWKYGYSQSQEDDILAKCPASCKRCGGSLIHFIGEAKHGAGHVKDAAHAVVHNAIDAIGLVNHAAHHVKSAAHDVVDRVTDAADHVAYHVKKAANRVAGNVESAAHAVVDRVTDAADHVKYHVKKEAKHVTGHVADVAHNVIDAVF